MCRGRYPWSRRLHLTVPALHMTKLGECPGGNLVSGEVHRSTADTEHVPLAPKLDMAPRELLSRNDQQPGADHARGQWFRCFRSRCRRWRPAVLKGSAAVRINRK